MARIEWLYGSVEDLKSIRAYISRDAPETAADFIARLIATTRRLKKLPLSGAVVPELNRPDIRELRQGSYRIIYRTRADLVEILAVFHAARMLDEDSIPGLDDE